MILLSFDPFDFSSKFSIFFFLLLLLRWTIFQINCSFNFGLSGRLLQEGFSTFSPTTPPLLHPSQVCAESLSYISLTAFFYVLVAMLWFPVDQAAWVLHPGAESGSVPVLAHRWGCNDTPETILAAIREALHKDVYCSDEGLQIYLLN